MDRVKNMLLIDGSFGEGGGQILRTAVALSALRGRDVRVMNIRARRKNPGLQPQHISAIKAVAELCNADVGGLKIGSAQIEFKPGAIRGGSFSIDVGTAGSVTLILQALLIAACGAQKSVEIELVGGTDVPWSPPIDYLKWVMLPFLNKIGYKIEISLIKRGFYPKGGGKLKASIYPGILRIIEALLPGRVKRIFGISYAEIRLKNSEVAERQRKASIDFLAKKLPGVPLSLELDYSSTLSLGSGVVLVAEMEKGRIGASALGERGKKAKVVGAEAASSLYEEINTGAAVDSHMADQIIPYLALVGGKVKIGHATQHTVTNIDVVNKFGFAIVLKENMLIAE